MASITLTSSNNSYTAPINNSDYVDAAGGTDTLILNWAALTSPVRYFYDWGQGGYTDDFSSTVRFYNFEIFKLTGGLDGDDLRGGNLADSLSGGGGNDTLTGYLGADAIDGGAGKDLWVVDYSSISAKTSITLLANGATYKVTASGAKVKNIEAINVNTGINKDTIDTSSVIGNDTISTGSGDDNINPGLGFDTVYAGAGVDTLTLDYSTKTTNIIHSGNNYQDSGRNPTTAINYYDVERFNITGGSGNDQLYGDYNNDKLLGGAGNDSIYSFAGVDTIDGGAGTDYWYADYGSLTVNISINIGDTVQSANTATISNIERLEVSTGIGNDVIVANKGVFNDVINSNNGNDSITTGQGIDVVNAGNGDDLLTMDWSATTKSITWSGDSNSQYYLSDNTNKLTAYSFERFNLTGGAGDDYLHGFAGVDTLTGGAENDTLDSGTGNATIDGGTGTDYWYADLSASSLAVVIDANTGQSAAQAISAGLSITAIEGFNLSTGAGDDNIDNNAYSTNDTVNTGAGNDRVALGLGSDNIYTAEGNDTIVSGRGTEQINAGSGDDTLIMDWSTTTQAITWSGNPYSNYWQTYISGNTDRIDYIYAEHLNLTGGSGDDYLRGLDNTDTLIGGAGNDTLDSNTGNATIDGGTGIDYWNADLSGLGATAVIIDATAGQTKPQATGAGSSVMGIEGFNLTTSAGNDNIDNSAYSTNDVVYANQGDDRIALGLGNDYTDGGDGTDTLVVDYSSLNSAITSDHYWWTSNINNYKSADGIALVSFNNFEDFNVAGGSADDDLYGGANADTLSGNAGDDNLYGGSGKDVISGGVGNDVWVADYYSTATNPLILNLDATGLGIVKGVGTALTGIENISLTTSPYSDVIDTLVMRGNNSISTGDGNDTVKFGGGNSYADGGNGSDILVVDFSSSTTAVRLSSNYSNWYNLYDSEGLNAVNTYNFDVFNIISGSGSDNIAGLNSNDTLNGGAGSDILIGNTGNDVLTGGAGNDIFNFNNYGNDVDNIKDASAGDIIRINNVTLTGSVSSGNGNNVGIGQVQLSVNNTTSISILYIGTDGSAGADVSVRLTGIYAANTFKLSGTDIKLTAGASSVGSSSNDTLTGSIGNDTLSGDLGDDLISSDAGDDSLSGGSGNDTLNGNDGDDLIDGGDDNDMLLGGIGADTLQGGIGADSFAYIDVSESPAGSAYHDVINDFNSNEGDKIDLSAIDANPVLTGDQAFNLVVNFTGSVGEIMYDSNNNLLIADINADGLVDMEIQLNGIIGLSPSDFVL